MTETEQKNYLESPKRLSQSIIWKLQANYYNNLGIDAWKEIPFYPTSNPIIGNAYAETIIAFLLDCLSILKKTDPIYIVEMATGSGVFSFYTLKALEQKLKLYPALSDLNVCYVMTDFTENIVEAWEKNIKFKPFIDSGLLDFSVFCPEDQAELHLRRKKIVVNSEHVKNPIVAIANYFFDSISQDYFQVNQGVLNEASIGYYQDLTIQTKEGKKPDTSKPHVNELKPECTYIPVSLPYYNNPVIDSILEYYGATQERASILFPIGAINVLRNLDQLSNGQMLLISSDKGFTDLSYIHRIEDPVLTPHAGAFSFMVNYHALGTYFEQQGGKAFFTEQDLTLTTMGAVLLRPNQDLALEHLNYYWQTQMLTQQPIQTLFYLKGILEQFTLAEEKVPDTLLKMMTAAIQLSYEDPYMFTVCAPYLQKAILKGNIYIEQSLHNLLHKIDNNLFKGCVGFSDALVWLRILYFDLGDYKNCLRINQQVAELYEADSHYYYYNAAIEEINNNPKQALIFYRQSLEKDPNFVLAQQRIDVLRV